MSTTATTSPIDLLREQYGSAVAPQLTCDGIPTFWTPRERVRDILGYLKDRIDRPYAMLYDLTAIDERMRVNRDGAPPSAFTVLYHLFSFERNEYIRMKTALAGASLSLDSITS
ncbi:MAG TPA: NADH-quinone oxidoreductase subunit C, partial [Terracidiphilus sp.]